VQDGLLPLHVVTLLEVVAHLLSGLTGERGREGEGRVEPHGAQQAVAQLAQSLHGRGEQGGLDELGQLGVEALLLGLGPEVGRIRGHDHPGHQLAALLLEGADLLSEVFARLVVGAAVHHGVASLGDLLGVVRPICVAVDVVRPEDAHLLVGRHLVPEREAVVGYLPHAPEDVVRPLEGIGRVAVPPEEVGLHRRVHGQAGSLQRFALVGHRVDRVRGRGRQDEVALVLGDEVAGHLRRAVGVGLAVFDHYVDRVVLAVAAHQTVGDELAPALGAVLPCYAEIGERPGEGIDEAHLDLAAGLSPGADGRGGAGRCRGGAGRCRGGAAGGLGASRGRGRCIIVVAAGGQQTAQTAAEADSGPGSPGHLEKIAATDASFLDRHLSSLSWRDPPLVVHTGATNNYDGSKH